MLVSKDKLGNFLVAFTKPKRSHTSQVCVPHFPAKSQ